MGTRTNGLQTLQLGVELEMLTCYLRTCGIQFAAPADWLDRRRRDHAEFHCPNGHAQSFQAKTKEELLREELQRTKRTVDYLRTDNQRLADQRATLKRSVAAQKGVATRLRNKAIAGECAFCHQRFPDVAEHVQAEHPGESAADEDGS